MKRFIFSIILLLITSVSFSQTQPPHTKKVVRIDNKLYWNKHLPFNIFLSTSKDSTDITLLETSTEFTKPNYFDTEGINYVRTRWYYDKENEKNVDPQQEITWPVYADGIPPTTTIKVEKFEDEKFEISFDSKDAVSGVEDIYYSINGNEFKIYIEKDFTKIEGQTIIKYYALDNVGNVEEIKSYSFLADVTSPKTNIDFKKSDKVANNVISNDNKLILNSSDNYDRKIKTFFSFNGEEFLEYKNPIDLKNFKEQSYKIYYYSQDSALNKEKVKSYEFYVDKSAPYISSSILGDFFEINGKKYSSGRARIQLVAFDNKAGVKDIFYTINDSITKKYENPFYLKGMNGEKKISFYAIDKVGNKTQISSQSESNITPYLDLTGPKLEYTLEGKKIKIDTGVIISSKTKVKLNASDSESGVKDVKYKINNTVYNYTDGFTLDKNGINIFKIIGFDNVNNRNEKEVFLYVDKTAPIIEHVFDTERVFSPDSVGVYPSFIKLYLAATDDLVGIQKIEYSINGSEYKTYEKAIEGFNNNSEYIIEVKVYDNLDNINTKKIEFKIKS